MFITRHYHEAAWIQLGERGRIERQMDSICLKSIRKRNYLKADKKSLVLFLGRGTRF